MEEPRLIYHVLDRVGGLERGSDSGRLGCMSTTRKKELVQRIMQREWCTGDVVKGVVAAFLDEVIDELAKGNRLELRGFGIFETRTRAACQRHSPKTFEKFQIASRRVVRFKAAERMRASVEGGSLVPEVSRTRPGRRPRPGGRAGPVLLSPEEWVARKTL